jgi:hypothetical protein
MKMEMQQMIERLLASQEQMMAKIKTDQEEMMTRMNTNQERMSASLREEIQSGQVEMRSIVDARIADMKDGRKETMACQEMVEAHLECEEPTSVDMEPEAEHWEIPKEDAIVKPIEGQRKRRRDQNLAMEHHKKPKERTQGYCGSQKRVTVASRRMTHCAGVAWLRRNIRRNRTRKQVERGAPKG